MDFLLNFPRQVEGDRYICSGSKGLFIHTSSNLCDRSIKVCTQEVTYY